MVLLMFREQRIWVNIGSIDWDDIKWEDMDKIRCAEWSRVEKSGVE